MRILLLFLTLCIHQHLSAQQPPGKPVKPLKNFIYADGMSVVGRNYNYYYGWQERFFPSINYERVVWDIPQSPFRCAIAGGFTPNIVDPINWAIHLSPRIYWGRGQHWLCMETQYWYIVDHTLKTAHSGTYPYTYKTRGVYLGLGYCLTTRGGIYVHPQFLVARNSEKYNSGNEYFTSYLVSLGLGYGF